MKLRFIFPAIAMVAGIAVPASAAAFMVNGIGATNAISADNNFKADLAGNYSYSLQTNDFSNLVLSGPARITFYALASESGNTDSFSGYGVTGTETNLAFDTSRVLGSADIGGGPLSELKFTSNLGVTGKPGSAQFAIFLPTGFNTGNFSTDWLVFGFDDTVGGDADFDDYIIGAQISPIPETHIWALMIAGFGMVGLQLRRNRKSSRAIAC